MTRSIEVTRPTLADALIHLADRIEQVEPELDEYQLRAAELQAEAIEAERLVRLDALALSLAGKRKAAIDHRQQSGIETVWLEDEDAFDGIDDTNRATEGASGSRHRYLKGATSYTKVTPPEDDNRCILLPNITGPYVEAAAAGIADILLPLDDWPFGLGPTPIPELTTFLEKVKELPDEQQVSAPGMSQPRSAGQIKASGEAEIERAKRCAEKAETRIKDWFTECQWHGKSRLQIDDAARVGTGIVKGPIPQLKKHYAWHDQEDGSKSLEIIEETKPVTDNVDYWNLFPDPACGENIHNGSFMWERGEITTKTLQDLRGQDPAVGYIDSNIELCLQEGPKRAEVSPDNRQIPASEEGMLFEIWWFHGALQREDLEAAGCDCSYKDEKFISIPAVVTVVNGRPIRASLNHMDKGSFPYDILVWRRRPGMPWGQGIGRQIRPAQRGITSCFRALMENAGLSAKPMLAVLRKHLSPIDGSWELFGGKIFEVDSDADVRDIKAAITTIQIDSSQAELLAIINFQLQLAENITGQRLMMGEQQRKAPDTVGVATIQNNNTSITQRRIARQFDDQVIEPGVTRYYDYLMQYGEDEEEKGLFVVDARSSSVLVERDIQNKNMIQLLGASQNPVYGVNPKKAFAETCKAMRIDPKKLQYSEKELEEQAQQQQPGPPPDPRKEIAELNADLKDKLETNRIAFEREQADLERQNKLEVAVIDERDKNTELASSERETLQKIQGGLAETAIKLKTTRELAVADIRADVHKHHNPSPIPPVVEPPGKAKPGKSFQS